MPKFDVDFSGELNEGTAVSDLDGRYRRATRSLANYFSEAALQRYRTFVEVEYLLHLSENGIVRELEKDEKNYLKNIAKSFSEHDFKAIKGFEKETNHDVKAVEYFVKSRLPESTSDIKEMVHFGLTSEDVTNLALSLSLEGGINRAILPPMMDILYLLANFAHEYKSDVMLARTHGQPASPTTIGKEFANVAHRFNKSVRKIAEFKYPGKLSGAVGNFNAHHAAFPEVDWENFAQDFVENRLGLSYNPYTTQILPHDEISGLFRGFISANKILEDFAQDCWRYISDDWFKQKMKEGETGSSTMPHKVNPIDFENSEGNLQMSNAILGAIADKMQISRLQRDLSGSTVTRKYGTALAYSLIAYKSMIKGLGKIEPDVRLARKKVEERPEVVAEAIQTILRADGFEKPYEKLKEMTRGKRVDIHEIVRFIDSLDVSQEAKTKLANLDPKTYIGRAVELTEKVVDECAETLREFNS